MATIFALRGRTWSALPAVALFLLFAACADGGGGSPTPPNDAGGSTETDATTPIPDAGGKPMTDASDAASSGFSRGRIASGTDFSCVLNESGAAVCWGPKYDTTRTPTNAGLTWIAAAGEDVCAIDGAGEIICWDSRIVGSGAVVRDVPPGPFVEVAVGSPARAEYACGRRASGEIACWRSANLSQRPELTTPPAGVTFNRISLGANAACGIQSDSTLRCWGTGVVMNNVPTGAFTDLAVDQSIGCAIDAAGRPACWGSAVAHFVTDFPPGQRSAQLAGSSYSGIMCSVLMSGLVFCSEPGGSYPLPVNNTNIREVAVSEDHYCFVYADRSVGCQSNLSDNTPYAPPAGLRVLAR